MLTEELVATINANRNRMPLWPWITFLCFLLWPATSRIHPVVTLFWPFASLVLILYIWRWDRARRTVRIEYPDPSASFAALCRRFDEIAGSQRIWRIRSRTTVTDAKRNAGASYNVTRSTVAFRKRLPTFVAANIQTPVIATTTPLYLFPDCILAEHRGRLRRLEYTAVTVDSSTTIFIESESFIPKDAPVVGKTWKYVNKNGTPDKRMKDNREYPELRYDLLRVYVTDLIDDVFHISAPGTAGVFQRDFVAMQSPSYPSAGVEATRETLPDTDHN
ncbi:MAG TPA: hypothetical protein VHI13_12930 [Candidatus Kapabacteria bacterium]|nr:hypothetical protein [Candidatus Kapabacteria bacterium]